MARADTPKQRGEHGAWRCRARDVAARAAGSGDVAALTLVRLVAEAHGVTRAELFHPSRSRAPIAATRQLAMYLMHVALGRTLTEVGRFFGRDRTTVGHACALIEDQRDDPDFEAEVAALEAALEAALDGMGSRAGARARELTDA